MNRFRKAVRAFFTDDRGQGTVEWVLITALIVVAIMALIYAFREPIFNLINQAKATVESWSAD